MANEFDLNEYLNRKLGTPKPDKITSILQARDAKIAELQRFRSVLEANSETALREQTIRDGRTWGEFGNDLAQSALQGWDGLAKLPAMVYDKATTGNFYGPETEKLSKTSDEREKLKSALIQASNQQKAEVVNEAGKAAKDYFGDGAVGVGAQVAAEFGTAFWEAAKDPETFPDFLAQQAPQLLAMGKIGRAAEVAAQAAAKAAPKLVATKVGQKVVEKAAETAAIGSGAVLQGVDVGSDTQQRLKALPQQLWEQNPAYVEAVASGMDPEEAKDSIISEMAMRATLKGGAASVLSTMLPGGSSIEKTLVGKQKPSFAAVPKAYVGEAGQEGIEEGTGRLFSNQEVKEVLPTQDLAEGVGGAAGQGAFMGGLLGGGMSAVDTALQKIGSIGSEKRQADAAKTKVVRDAAVSGDVTQLTDPKSKNYDPEAAIAALYANTQREDATPEAKQANLEKAAEVVSQLETRREALAQQIENTSPDALQAKLDANRAALDAETIAAMEEEIQARRTDPDEKGTETLRKQAEELDNQISSAKEMLDRFNTERQIEDVDVDAEVAKITADDPAASQAAAEKIIRLAMAVPERLDAGVATALANDTTNGLSDAQRSFLRQFSEARIAENKVKDTGDVANEILNGSNEKGKTRFFGLANYRQRLATALNIGNQKEADYQLGQLALFQQNHERKTAAAIQALEAYKQTGVIHRIERLQDGQWEVKKGEFASKKEQDANGGLNVSKNTESLIGRMQQEVAAISSVSAELKAAYAAKFNGTPNVQNVSQASQGNQATQTVQATAPATTGAVNGTGTQPTVQANQAPAEAPVEASGSSVKTVEAKSTQSTESQLQSTEETTTTTEEVVPKSEEVEAKTGVLQAIQETSPEGTAHAQKKLGDFVQQGVGKESDGSKRPLVAVKDFVSRWMNGEVNIRNFLKQDFDLTAEQSRALDLFKKAFQAWSEVIDRNLKPTHNENFNYEDPMRYLIQLDQNKKATTEENLKAAISAAVFSFVADQAGKSPYNDAKAINAILGRKADEPVSSDAYKKLGNAGTYQSQIIDTLGTAVFEALGFKSNKDAPQDIIAKLRVSLGGHALKLMEDRGLLQRTDLWNSEMAALRDEEHTGKDRKGHHFFKLARDAQGQVTGLARVIAEGQKGSQNIIQKLFGIEPGLEFPSLVPQKGLQKSSDTGMGLPSKIRSVFKKNQERPWKINKDFQTILSAFPDEQDALEMAGVETDTSTVHSRNLSSFKSKNDALVREYRNFVQFLSEMILPSEKGMDQEFYLKQEMWKQQRSGYTTNAVNPNASKISRWLIAPTAWQTDIKLDNKALVDSFLIRVAEGFGIKPEKADSQVALDKLNEKLAAPEMKAAIQVAQQMLFSDQQLSDEQRQAFKDAVKAGGQKFHTVAALIAFARYQQAVDTKADNFTTNLMGEVDGVSNGSVLNSVLYGVAATGKLLNQFLEKGGIYSVGSKFGKYNLWRGTAGHQDIYESNAVDLEQHVARLFPNNPVVAAIWNIAGKPIDAKGEATKDGRDLLKGPINPLNYGGGFESVLKKMSYDFVDKFYSKLESAAKIENVQQQAQEFDRLANNINQILKTYGQPLVPLSNSPQIQKFIDSEQIQSLAEFYLNFTLSKGQEKAIAEGYSTTIGVAVEQVIGTNFAPFLERSKLVTKAVGKSYELYEAIYKVARQDMIKALNIPMDRGVYIHDLSAEQEMELATKLKPIIPMMHTAMSKQDDNIENGILLSKRKRKQNDSLTYKVAVKFGTPLKNEEQASQLVAAARTMQEESPGVLAISGTTHALDSSISHTTQGNRHVLNNHDALGDGVGTLAQTATELNQNTWDSLLNYSPVMEAYNALMRVVQGVVAMEKAGTLTSEMKAELRKQFKNVAQLDGMVSQLFDEAIAAERSKLEAMSEWAVVDQYAMDGGSYTVTPEDRKAAADRLSSLAQFPSQENNVVVYEFTQAVFGQQTAKPAKPAVQPTPKAEPVVTKSPLGELGTPKIQSNATLVNFFKYNPVQDADALVDWMLDSTSNPFATALLKALRPLVSGTKVKYLTPNSKLEDVLGKPLTNARGWTSIQGTATEIYLLSPDFVNSGLTPEVLLHELVHAALARAIESSDANSRALVNELTTILEKAKEYTKKNNITEFGAALENVHELVSYGMTNKAFQDKVLRQFKMKSKTRGNTLVDGMKAMIDTFVTFLKGKNNAVFNDGLTTLVQNVSGLFAAAAQAKPNDTNVSLAMAAQIDRYTTLELHQALDDGSVSHQFQEHLASLLDGIVEKLHGPFGAFAAQMEKVAAKTPLDVFLKAQETGMAPFASEVLANMSASQQEAFAIEQVEATVKTALEGNDAQSKMAYRALYNLYTEMYNRFSKDGREFFKGDWSLASPSEKQAAKAKYDFVFGLSSNADNRSDYLARFAAMGLAHEGFNQMLQVATESDIGKLRGKETFVQKLQRWFESVLSLLQDKVTNTYAGQRADIKMEILVGQLVDIEHKKRAMLKAREDAFNPLAPIEKGASKLAESARKKIGEFAESDFAKKFENGLIAGPRALASTVANDRVEAWFDTAQKFYEQNVTAQGSMIVSMLKELTGHKEKLQAVLRLTKKFEGDRKDQITSFTKQARNAFAKQLTKEVSGSVTDVVLRTGLHNLLDTYSLAQLENLVGNEAAQDIAIADLVSLLGPMKSVYLHQIKGLAYYKATEKTKVKALMMNAHVIARMSDTQYAKQITEAQAKQAELIIKQLITLYALKYTSAGTQQQAKEVFREENARGDSVGNGIEFLLKAHKQMEAEALERQFRGNPTLMIHGYTPEILNPHTQFEVAHAARGEHLRDYGYAQGAMVEIDPADPDRRMKRLYVIKGAGMVPRVSGALLFQSDKAKGTTQHDGFITPKTVQGIENAQIQAAFNQKLVNPINTDPDWDPRKEANSYSAPLYNEQGKIVNWRYLMHKTTKDDILERDNRFDRVMGVLAGDVFSKPRVREQNKAVLEALRQVYKEDALHAKEYVYVGPKSSDSEISELWALLPHDTRKDILDVWGQEGMYVKPDSFDLVFGYRKRSLAEPLIQKNKNRQKEARGQTISKKDELNMLQEQYVLAMEWALTVYARYSKGLSGDEAQRYAKRSIVFALRSERAWQEVVREMKAIYVIKSVSTMVGNMRSNLTQLVASGVSLNEIRQHLPVAIRTVTNYTADMDELRELENQIKFGYTQGNEAEIERKIVRLKDAIARNPAKELIDAGLLPSIVEDVEEDEDIYSYKTELAKKTEKYTDKLNPQVKQVGRFIYMTKDTKLYQALHRATQLSDFAARYVLYHHLISKQEEPMSKAQAIHRASEDYVNYDIQMHRNIQYMDDMGLIMFTKYFLRMQRVLLRMGRENPARVVGLALANNYLNLGSNVLDSSALNHIGNNPFGLGALGFPGALDDLATVKAAMAVVK